MQELGKAWETTAHLDTPQICTNTDQIHGKVGPNHWSSNQVTLRTNLVRTEDKTIITLIP